MNPIDAVTHADPYPYYAELVAERPLAFDESLQLWVAAGAEQVTEMLRAPGLRVRPPGQPVPPGITGTPAGRIFGTLVRMKDGEAHNRLKAIVTAALAQARPVVAHDLAAGIVKRDLDGGPPALDELMFTVPVQVVARLCGLTEPEAAEAAALTGAFVTCLRPDADSAALQAADTAAERLSALLPPEPRPGDDLLAVLVRAAGQAAMPPPHALTGNAVGLLSQTYEATAGLIGNTLLGLAREGRPRRLEPFVREVARHDAPVQNTRRFAADPTRCGTAEIEPGQAVLVVLAAANRDPAANPDPHVFSADRTGAAVFTFGAAAHRCPGQDLATAIAAGAIGALLDHGLDPATGVPRTVAYRPSPNARIPDFSRAESVCAKETGSSR